MTQTHNEKLTTLLRQACILAELGDIKTAHKALDERDKLVNPPKQQEG